MTIAPFTRTPELGTLRREMDRLFENFYPTRGDEDLASAVWAPRADVSETDDAFLVWIDLPGIKPEDIDVTFEDGMLKVSGERHTQQENEAGQYHRIERTYGRFFRSFRFGDNIDPDRISANWSDGVLTVRIQKQEASRPRRIEVGRMDSGRGQDVQVS